MRCFVVVAWCLPGAAWALSAGTTLSAGAVAAPAAPAASGTAQHVAGVVRRVQEALDEATAVDARGDLEVLEPLPADELVTRAGAGALVSRLRERHHCVVRVRGFDGGLLRAGAGAVLDDDGALGRVGGAVAVSEDRPAEYVGVFGGDGPGRFVEGRYGGGANEAVPKALATEVGSDSLDESRTVLGCLGRLLARATLGEAEAKWADDVSCDTGREGVSTTAHRLCRYAPCESTVVPGASTSLQVDRSRRP